MARNIEQLLNAVADLDRFTKLGTEASEDMSLEELDMIAAAANLQRIMQEPEEKEPSFIKRK